MEVGSRVSTAGRIRPLGDRVRIGIDTYSYHRLLGAVRNGEQPAPSLLLDGGPAALVQARALGCDAVSVQTCFLPSGPEAAAGFLEGAAGGLELILAWGHPDGLAFGRDSARLAELMGWLSAANELGCRLMRVVVGGPALRHIEPVAAQIERTIGPLRSAANRAADYGISLAVENHGDLDSSELEQLIERAASPNVGVCFDSANAVRVGEDPVAAATRLASRVLMVHLKDIESPERATDMVAGPCSVPFGCGVVPVKLVLAALAKPLADGCPVCVEIGQVGPGVDERELVSCCVHWLQERYGPES
jgi:sugar phosphate isomerase/epimerase